MRVAEAAPAVKLCNKLCHQHSKWRGVCVRLAMAVPGRSTWRTALHATHAYMANLVMEPCVGWADPTDTCL